MHRLTLVVVIMILTVPLFAAAQPSTEDEKTLYSIGFIMGKQTDVFDLLPKERDFVMQGVVDSLQGKKPVVEPDAYQQKINQLAQTRMKINAEKQKVKSRDFLESAAKEAGVQKTTSGLIYIPIKEGTGIRPNAADTVRVHYTGTFVDGKVFDSSVKRGKPAEFKLDQVIKCWTEGVAMMKVGGKAKLLCPASIAYGEQGRPPVIPGEAALIFEVELLDVINTDAKK
jgi:FKBP-type peptidyl-prolyl cis-trans isomerase FkpA